MTTFAQWRSPDCRLGLARFERAPNHYDLRLVDQFYAYCQVIARNDRFREAAGRSLHARKLSLCAMMIAAALFGFYLFERLGALTSLL